jgi:long-subunit fatty acid transport protein
MPKSIALDFQSGIAKDTLLFGSIRWTEWSAWHVRPPRYFGAVGDEITGFDNDVLTYQLGVGRRLNENFAVFARIGYEKANGGDASRLAPTDGSRSIGIGGTYTKDNLKITGGIEYVKLGDATDSAPTRTVFSGNDAIGFGVTVGIRF